ncbi:PB1 domain [Dillenia turbinata]|uniref:PB1 domain n=1 Tax=Dillenia turbinata TaxID=194707 RepID=A0AAN8VYI3_9MAGN
MGKQTGKKKKLLGGGKSGDGNVRQGKAGESSNSPKGHDKDTEVFITMSQELKNEGNKLFQKRDYEGAMLKYEKAIKLLPRNHIDVAYLRSNVAACYMQMGLSDYPRAVHECNLALEVSPKYSKALLKRARCYEALNRIELAIRDVNNVLNMEPNNLMALEIAERVTKEVEEKGAKVDDKPMDWASQYVEPPCASPPPKAVREKMKKKKGCKTEEQKTEGMDKLVVEEIVSDAKMEILEENSKKEVPKMNVKEVPKKNIEQEVPKKNVKLVFGEDIRLAEVPVNCSLLELRGVIGERFPGSDAVLVKYKDQEGDLVTITNSEELRWAESLADPQGLIRLHVVEVNSEQDPFLEEVRSKQVCKLDSKQNGIATNGNARKGKERDNRSCYMHEWIIEFAQMFKDHVGLSSDAYLDLHELGMELYSEALEDTVTSEEAQILFDTAAEKFQEMAALALFNWGNVHMARARKRMFLPENESTEAIMKEVKSAYEWAQKEYVQAGKRYEEALKIKPDFYEGFLALGQQQFEQAKLSWYYAIGHNVDLETWPSTEILQLYNNAEDNMERGMQLWEKLEEQRRTQPSKPTKVNIVVQRRGLDGLFNDISADELEEQASEMRSQINLLWGTLLYERSIVEFKLNLPVWQECLEVAVEKFELAGASPTDIAVMIKNHCSNNTASDGLGFQIDEIVQAWNEMYEAKKWQSGVPSFRLEPLLRRRVSNLYRAFEHA